MCFFSVKSRNNSIQPTGSKEASLPSVRPYDQGIHLSVRRSRGRGEASSSHGSQNRIHAVSGQKNLELSLNMAVGNQFLPLICMFS